MNINPTGILKEYENSVAYKSAIGNRGLYEQSKINERFFIGDQWHGAKCGNERPLVRHNIIKRIGDFKMAQVLSAPISVNFSADGIPNTVGIKSKGKLYQNFSQKSEEGISPLADNDEINLVMSALSNYQKVTAERVGLNGLCSNLLKNAYITGTGILYTYWDSTVATGLYADKSKLKKIKGDICCEVLDINDIVFADPYIEDVQAQPFIIISASKDLNSVLKEARLFGADTTLLNRIEDASSDGKVTILSKLYKSKNSDGSYTVKCVKATENAVVRKEFDTGLSLYPLALFSWERRNNLIYGESEVTFLIPNQIAINRMITANVWSAMTTGMPIMLVNGDTVTDKITNDPGQIIKIFGSNEDVAGAVKYISPPTFNKEFENSINSLIENTLTQSGANEVALGDSKADNATALATMRDAAVMPLQIVKNRFYLFCEDVARIWTDFWLTHYSCRPLKTKDKNGIKYEEFDAEKYRDLVVNVNIEVGNSAMYTDRERTELLITMFEKGIIDREQFIKRLPDGAVTERSELLQEKEEDR